MKKSVLGILCLIVVMSCDIPQSITIKGNPGIYLSMGSPFEKLEEGKRLEDYISPAKIREMMGEQENTKIYDYQPPGFGPNEPQTYIVHYPIAEMKYDLTEYVNDVMSDVDVVQPYAIPDSVAVFPPGVSSYYFTPEGAITSPGNPLYTIPLADISKLVIEVNGGPFALELDYSVSYEENLRVRIPAFGIDTYEKGIKAGDKLRFVNPGKTQFKPGDNLNSQGELEVYVQVLGPCSGIILPETVFEWTTAIIDTSGDSDMLAGQYPIKNSLGNFLGNGVGFKEVKAYIYVNGLDSGAEMVLKGGTTVLVPEGTPLVNKPRPSFNDPFETQLPPHSIDSINSINLTALFNNYNSSILEYRIGIDQMVIHNDAQIAGKIITADMVILLPLEFNVTTPSSESGYVKLEMGEVFSDSADDGDLFNRTGNDNDLFNNINSVTIFVKNFRNTIIDNPMSIMLKSTDKGNLFRKKIDLDSDKEVIPLTIGYDEIPNPFNPRFEILLKEDSPGAGATLKIKRQANPPEFDFIITVEVQTDLNIKL